MPTMEPNKYVLTGKGLTITYLVSWLLGLPELTYADGQQTLSFRGDEIRVVDTEIGKLVSVTIQKTVDAGSTSFSVLLPVINLANGATKQSFDTVGVRTVHKTALVQPATGVREIYRIFPLEGEASIVKVPLAAGQGGA
jgi:hypothetical protein